MYVVHYTCIILCVRGWIQIDIAESSRVSIKERGVELIDLLRERLEQRHTLTELQGKKREKYICTFSGSILSGHHYR